MKLLVAFSLSAMLLAAGEGQSKAKAAQAASRVAKPLEIPKGAVETEPGTFRHTDAAGKKWVYRKTPFGVSRQEEKAAAVAAAAVKVPASDPHGDVRAFDEGESIRFERTGPFGVSRWKARKSELSELERTVWTREKTRSEAKKD